MRGKVLFGYQGWFSAKNDGANLDFRHWTSGGVPTANNLVFDLWPDTSEYPTLYETNLQYSNSKKAGVFSCYDYTTVDVHFKWMNQYKIDGVFLQRFLSELNPSSPTFHFRNVVLQHVIAAAAKYGRLFSVMYDISGAHDDTFVDALLADWEYLVHNFKLTNSPNYIRDDTHGLPVVVVWGVGFTGHPGNQSESRRLISQLKSKGLYVIGGVPYYWRTGVHDSKPGYLDVYSQFNLVSPWAVGRYSDNASFDRLVSTVVKPDLQYTSTKGIGYAPVIFPGFSWANLAHNPRLFNQIPRRGGQFFAHQADVHVQLKPTFIYVAMFDEVNESTAMFKAATTKGSAPSANGAQLLYLDVDGVSLPNDFYLQLGGNVTRMFHEIHSLK